jgi:tetratricopeptide (TPR) repeat protein
MIADAASLAKLEDLLSRTASAYDGLLKAGAASATLQPFRQGLGQIQLKLGQHYLAAGKMPEALGCGEQAMALLPDNREAPLLAARALLAEKRADRAIEILSQATEIHPADATILGLLGQALLANGRPAEAIQPLEAACGLLPHDAGLSAVLANALAATGQIAASLQAWRHALSIEPENLNYLSHYAGICSNAGAFDEARVTYARLIDLQPARGSHHRMFGLLHDYQPGDPRIGMMDDLLVAAQEEDAREFNFALFRAREAVMDHDRAFGHLKAANDILRGQLNYQPQVIEALFANAEAAFPTGGPATGLLSARDESPIFIVGMPRCGSTLTEQILACHPDVHAAGETTAFPSLVEEYFLQPSLAFDPAPLADGATVHAIGRKYLAALCGTGGLLKRTVDKYLTNFLSIGFIKAVFPKARIIHCHRDPLANCFAIYASYFETNALGFNADMEQTARYYVRYRALMRHWQALFGEDIHDLSYERLTEDQEGETRRLLDYCGLGWDPACLEFHRNQRAVMTASFIQVRQPLYSGVDRRTGHYLSHLGPMIDILRQASLYPHGNDG